MRLNYFVCSCKITETPSHTIFKMKSMVVITNNIHQFKSNPCIFMISRALIDKETDNRKQTNGLILI